MKMKKYTQSNALRKGSIVAEMYMKATQTTKPPTPLRTQFPANGAPKENQEANVN